MTTMEQAVLQIQQELLMIRAQIASRVHEDAPSPIDVNHWRSPKTFSGKEEDFQQWARQTEAFFAEVIKESEVMLEWASDQPMEITTTAIDLEFLPTESNGGRGVRNLEFVLQQMREVLRTRTRQEANDRVDNSRKNPLEAWRRLQERYDPTARGRKRNLLRTVISSERCSLQELQAGIERWESKVVRYEELKGKLDDEIKRAGLESLVQEVLEKHLIFNSNRSKTFEDVRSEIVTYVEEKFGLRIRDFKPSKAEFCKRSNPSDVGVVSSLLSGKGKWSSDLRCSTFSTILQCKQEHVQMSGKGNKKQVMVHERTFNLMQRKR